VTVAAARENPELERAWRLTGRDSTGRAVSLTLGETRLTKAYLGLTIGRHAALCDLVIDDPTVSRRHCRIARDSDGLYVEDLNSLNGTACGAQTLRAFEPLTVAPGQALRLGEVELTLQSLEPPDP